MSHSTHTASEHDQAGSAPGAIDLPSSSGSPAEVDPTARRSVLISGAGPVGMILALELSMYGVRSTLIERHPQTTQFPKMDLTNSRSMELLDRLGLADDVRSVGVASKHSLDVVFYTKIAQDERYTWTLQTHRHR